MANDNEDGWIPITDYHHKPQDLSNILFVLSNCPYTGAKNRVHCGYMINNKSYEESEWYSWEFHNYDPIGVDLVMAWREVPSYQEWET